MHNELINSASTVSLVQYWLSDYWAQNGDPRVRHFPLMGSFSPFLAILALYTAFVLFIGPRWMQNRKPFLLTRVMIVYNVFMSLANGYFFCRLLFNGRNTVDRMLDVKFPHFGEPNKEEAAIISDCHLYLLSKLIDLLDTVFFVLRKKQSQVTGLHFYHHLSVPFYGWMYFRLNGICHMLIPFCVMNTFIHVLMYGYYGLTAMGPAIRPYLWWKRYLTQLQIGQFVLMFVYGVYFTVFQQGYCQFLIVNNLLQAIIYMILFTRFYFKSYYQSHKVNTVPDTSNNNGSCGDNNNLLKVKNS